MLENIILKMYDYKLTMIVVGILSEGYMIGQFAITMDEDFLGFKKSYGNQDDYTLYMIFMSGLVYKNIINLIELKQGVIRIVDYDVEEKT